MTIEPVPYPYVVWHGTELGQQGWHPDGHALALEMVMPKAGEHLYVILNSYWESLPSPCRPTPGNASWTPISPVPLTPPAPPSPRPNTWQIPVRA